MTEILKNPMETGTSPWDGSELCFSKDWEFNRNEKNSFQCVADQNGVLFIRFTGWSIESDFVILRRFFSLISDKLQWEGKNWVLIFDCSLLDSIEISARKSMIELLMTQKKLKGVFFYSPSYLIKQLIQMANMFYNPLIRIEVVYNWGICFQHVSQLLGLPKTVFNTDDGTVCQRENSGGFHKDIEMILQVIGNVEWDKPGFTTLDSDVQNSSWRPFLTMISMIKNDLDALIVRRISRRNELHEAYLGEMSLHKKMSTALEQSRKARKKFEQESKRNLTLTRVIVDTQRETLFALGEIIESRSRETANHIRRVAEYSTLLARLKGLTEREQLHIQHASPMHDAGKIAIPDAILNKPGKLTPEEFEIMKDHARMGWEMLKGTRQEIIQYAATIAYQHHEKWNGKGYPNGLHGENIHLFGRMVALSDVFDALGSDRCYKKAWELDKVLDLIHKERGEQFDPVLVDLFFSNLSDFLTIKERFPDASS